MELDLLLYFEGSMEELGYLVYEYFKKLNVEDLEIEMYGDEPDVSGGDWFVINCTNDYQDYDLFYFDDGVKVNCQMSMHLITKTFSKTIPFIAGLIKWLMETMDSDMLCLNHGGGVILKRSEELFIDDNYWKGMLS